jgi:hypothetical protein
MLQGSPTVHVPLVITVFLTRDKDLAGLAGNLRWISTTGSARFELLARIKAHNEENLLALMSEVKREEGEP